MCVLKANVYFILLGQFFICECWIKFGLTWQKVILQFTFGLQLPNFLAAIYLYMNRPLGCGLSIALGTKWC